MSRNLHFPLLLSSMIAAGAVWGYIDSQTGLDQTAEITFQSSIIPGAQPVRERRWRTIRFVPAHTIGDEASSVLELTGTIRSDRAGHLYVLDAGDGLVKKFDPRGRLAQRFGPGKGPGPGQFQFPSDFALTEEGGVWITDAARKSISIFDGANRLQRVIEFQGRPLRILQIPGGGHLVMQLAADHLFEVYSPAGKRVAAFGQIIAEQADNAMALDGWIVANDRGTFTYAPYRIGLISSFSYQGGLHFAVAPIRPIPLPVMNVDRQGIRRAAPGGMISASSVGHTPGRIYVATTESGAKGLSDVLDFYDDGSGRYIESIRLPVPSRTALWAGDTLYTAQDSSITRWQTGAPAARSSRAEENR